MKSFAVQAPKSKSYPHTNTGSDKTLNGKSAQTFSDNRAETSVQRKIKEMANSGSREKVAVQLQSIANNALQRQGIEEEEPLQGQFITTQRKEVEEEEPLQGKFETTQRQEEEPLQGKFETVQRKEPEEEELLQGKFITVQRKEQEEEMLQGKFEPIQKKENNTGLPDNLKAGIENLSGVGMDDVKVHYNSDKPATLQAHAYAQGTNIHVAPGQEKHLPHEAWHVVQQKQGRVKPTMQMKGKVNVNDDKGLEKEADVMGAKALESGGYKDLGTQPKQDTIKNPFDKAIQRSAIIQLVDATTMGGDWTYRKYNPLVGPPKWGQEIELDFDPNDKVNATQIGLIQTVNTIKQGQPYAINNNQLIKNRSIKAGNAGQYLDKSDEGFHVDRASGAYNPIYGTKEGSNVQEPEFTPFKAKTNRIGKRIVKSGEEEKEKASLRDFPKITNAASNSSAYFETTALAISGEQKGTYYGSVKWGWKTDALGNHAPLVPGAVSQGTPTATFMKSAKLWNSSSNDGGKRVKPIPLADTKRVKAGGTTLYRDQERKDRRQLTMLAENTEVQTKGAGKVGNMYSVTVMSGEHMGKTGYIIFDFLV